MDADRTENEPEEYDPEAEFRDPESDSLTIPKVETEDAGSDLRTDLRSEFEEDAVDPGFSTGEADVSSELLTEFWALVLVINAAVLAYALALLFLFFEGETTLAAVLLGAGLALTGFAVRRYRSVQRTEFSSSADDGDADGTADADDDSDDAAGDTAADGSLAADAEPPSDGAPTGDSDGADASGGTPDDDGTDRP